MNPLRPYSIKPVSAGICQVHTSDGLHVGNLKLIGGVWKFKAIGYDADGRVIPGGGPLTEQHNTVFAELDAIEISRTLSPKAGFKPF